jgi:hypothetical protein
MVVTEKTQTPHNSRRKGNHRQLSLGYKNLSMISGFSGRELCSILYSSLRVGSEIGALFRLRFWRLRAIRNHGQVLEQVSGEASDDPGMP